MVSPGGRACCSGVCDGQEATVGSCPCCFLSSPCSPPEPSEAKEFELNFMGGVPGPTSQDLLCEIEGSTSPVVLHIEAAFKVLLVGLAGVGHRAHSQAAQ